MELRWQLADREDPQLALFDAVVGREPGRGEYRGLEFLHVEAQRLINEVPKQAQLPFRFTINVYRGCSHACTYCFARPTHKYLGLDAGRDFETKIVVKTNAVELARAETRPGRWAGDHIAMGTNTDPYQPAEGKYRLTRGVAAVLAERGNPFSILTKSPLVLRDLDILADAALGSDVRVDFSIGTLDEEVWKASEPGTPHPRRRIDAMAKLNAAGVPSGVLIGPVLPGLSDRPDQVEAVVRAAVDAGATFVAAIHLHLRRGVKEQYLGWLAEVRPELLGTYRRLYDGRAYARDGQEQLSRLVRGLVAKHGGPEAPRRSRPSAQPQRRRVGQLSLL